MFVSVPTRPPASRPVHPVTLTPCLSILDSCLVQILTTLVGAAGACLRREHFWGLVRRERALRICSHLSYYPQLANEFWQTSAEIIQIIKSKWRPLQDERRINDNYVYLVTLTKRSLRNLM